MSPESKTHTGKKEQFFVVVYNAHAGRATRTTHAHIHAFFEKRRLPYVVTDMSPCDWNEIREKLNEYDDVRVIAAGGDGTLRLVFENLWKKGLLEQCTVGFVPLGSANVAALSFRLPLGLQHALTRAVAGSPTPIDLGLINNTHIFFIAAIFGVASNITTGTRRKFKKRLGGIAYILSINTLVRNDYRGEEFTISFEHNGEQQEITSHSMIVCNQLNIARLTPLRGIRPDDEHLHFITLHNTTPWGFLQVLYDFFRGKRDTHLLRHKKFTHARYTLQDFTGAVHLDGDERRDLGTTLEFRVLPRAAKLIV
jgi:diacylglycerol kinase family enzyme